MFEWFTSILAHWHFIFINGAIDYLADNFTNPLITRTLGGMGAYVANGLTFTAKQEARATSYFQGLGGTVSSMWGGGSTQKSGVAM